MDESMTQAWKDSILFWDQVYAHSDTQEEEGGESAPEDWQKLAPSLKQLHAIVSLAENATELLDYGCGQGWASVIAAKAGCPSVTAVDVAANAAKHAAVLAERYDAAGKVYCQCISPDWLEHEAAAHYDAFFSSNVLDVVPAETAEMILREVHRIMKKGARLVISLNDYMEPADNPERKITVRDRHYVFVDGVLQLNTLTDAEWQQLFEKYFRVECREYYAWPGEKAERRRLFTLSKP